MTQEELIAVIEAYFKSDAGTNYLQIIFLIISWLAASYYGALLREKAKSSVTKSDIENITRKVEEIKIELEKLDRISIKKYELKYNACLNMLGILDAYLSHRIKTNDSGDRIQPDLQYTTIEEARKCHNDLLLTIDNQDILKLIMEMLVENSDKPLEDLDKIRELIREELGFGCGYRVDEKYTWLARVPFNKVKSFNS
jgi:hypothetical protein